MNREIKFRGISLKTKEFVFGDMYYNNGNCFICSEDHSDGADTYYNDMVDPETVGQFTGLHDKNGNEIYEGDIIKWTWDNNKSEIERVEHSLEWDRALSPETAPFMSAWGSTCGRYFRTFMNIYDPVRYSLVIGNIHENPELLKEATND